MTARGPRLPVHTSTLTARQKEVLALIARGRTNFEIATALGISLETAKYHVTEILTRLEVESREEAAVIWRADRSIGGRFRAMVPGGGRAWWGLAGGAGAILVTGLAVLLVLALKGGDGESAVAPPPIDSPTAGATPQATSSAASTVVASPPPLPGGRTTGIPGVDAVLTALLSGDPAGIDPLVERQTLGCTTRLGIGGPPKCPDGVANGTPVSAFPWGVGEFGFYLDDQWNFGELLASQKFTSVIGVHRAQRVVYDPVLDNEPSGSYVALMEPFRRVHIHDGKIVYIDNAGFASRESVIASVNPADWVLAPSGSAVPSGRTGVPEIDTVLTAIESRDGAQVEPLIQMVTLPCTTAVGLGGPPKCPDGVPDGTPVTAFPSTSSSLSWNFDKAAVAAFVAMERDVIGVYRAQYRPYDVAGDRIPSGSFVVVTQPPGQFVVQVHIHGDSIIATDTAGYAPLDRVIAEVDPADWILAPR